MAVVVEAEDQNLKRTVAIKQLRDELRHERSSRDRFFHDYLLYYTNAATLVNADFRDTEEGEGLFSGFDPQEFKGLTQRVAIIVMYGWYAVAGHALLRSRVILADPYGPNK